MYIKRVTLRDFGKLNGTIEFDPNRCNIICQDNEYGKTTIMDAVLYTLYNFPTSGFSRDTLKPKERYRPWGDSKNGFIVELELRDIGGRDYNLRADFNRQQPFTLHDANTLQPIPLEGMNFGQRYLRMPLASFTQCFFLRQDEKEGGRSQLVTVIEEAAASNRRDTPGNVSSAIERLASPRIASAGVASEPILVRNVLKRLEDRRVELLNNQEALESALERHRREIEASDEVDNEIADLERRMQRDNIALLFARRQEKQLLLNRFRESREAQAERAKQLSELEPYAEIDPANRSNVMSLLGDWRLTRDKLNEARAALENAAGEELKATEAELATYPESAANLAETNLDELRNYRSQLTDRTDQLTRNHETARELESTLGEQGIPIERLAELHEADTSLSPSDREILFEHNEARNEAQTALTAIEKNVLEAREQAIKAKARRSWFTNVGMGITVAVVAIMVLGIVLLLTGAKFFGWVSLIGATVVGIAAMMILGSMRTRISTQELEPALQAEITLGGESRKIQEQLETIETEYQATLDRLGLTPEQIQELREIEHWKQAANPWVNARQAADRLTAEIATIRENALPLIGLVKSDVGADDVSPEVLGESIERMEKYFRLNTALKTATDKADKLRGDEERLAGEFSLQSTALEELVNNTLTGDEQDLEAKARLFLDGCEKALKLRTLRDEYGAVQGMTDEEAATLQSDIESFNEQLQTLLADQPDELANETLGGQRAEEIERSLAQARRRRDDLKEQRNRGFREAEQAVNDWRTKGPVIEAELNLVEEEIAGATEFAEACALAHNEMSEIAAQVYTQWATALNERVNRIVPLVNDRYSDVALSPELDVSLHSHEAGRRLESREVQGLSKGARDQILLAMRVAIAQYLSAHVGNLPLALDEPFAHWDDQRFTEGMRFLTRLSDQHQVILLSCHSWRYGQLKETAADIMDKITMCELEPNY